jgi:hypothetical protein
MVLHPSDGNGVLKRFSTIKYQALYDYGAVHNLSLPKACDVRWDLFVTYIIRNHAGMNIHAYVWTGRIQWGS